MRPEPATTPDPHAMPLKKPRTSRADMEEALILSLVLSLGLILLTVFGWSVWTMLTQTATPWATTALPEIP